MFGCFGKFTSLFVTEHCERIAANCDRSHFDFSLFVMFVSDFWFLSWVHFNHNPLVLASLTTATDIHSYVMFFMFEMTRLHTHVPWGIPIEISVKEKWNFPAFWRSLWHGYGAPSGDKRQPVQWPISCPWTHPCASNRRCRMHPMQTMKLLCCCRINT